MNISISQLAAKLLLAFCIMSPCASSAWGSNNLVQSRGKVKLSHLPKSQSSEPEGGNFLQLLNGDVLFFTWDEYHIFRDVLSKGAHEQDCRILAYNPETGKKAFRTVHVSLSAGELRLDESALTPDSVDRLRLSSAWQKVLSHDWNYRCSICDLHDGRFLISGGVPTRPHHFPLYEALIFDGERNEVISEFHLAMWQQGHTSLLVEPGTVMLMGANNKHLEIVDVNHEKTLYSCEDFRMYGSTGCPAGPSKVVLVGGMRGDYSTRVVSLFDVNHHTFEDIGKVKVDRVFGSMDNRSLEHPGTMEYTIDRAIQPIGHHKFIVTGGGAIHFYFGADFASGAQNNAEIFGLREPK